MSQARELGFFDDTKTPDVVDWISICEQVSLYNRWDQTIMLASVIFCLKDTPRVWLKTHEC